MAARRWLAAHGPEYARFDPVYLGDDLYARQPICQAVGAMDGHFLFVCKPTSHPTLQQYLTGVELPALIKKIKHGRQKFTYSDQWLGDVPLRDGPDALAVNWLIIEIRNRSARFTHRNRFITDLPVNPDTIVELAACGRARWKIENESFNTLKTKRYNLEHNFGHGKANLSTILATLNLLAFAFHTAAELTHDLWRRAMRQSWLHLLQTLAFESPPPVPP